MDPAGYLRCHLGEHDILTVTSRPPSFPEFRGTLFSLVAVADPTVAAAAAVAPES